MRILGVVFYLALLPTAVLAAGGDYGYLDDGYVGDAEAAQQEMDDLVTRVFQGKEKSDALFEASFIVSAIARGADVTKCHKTKRYEVSYISVACDDVDRVSLIQMILDFWETVAANGDKDRQLRLVKTKAYRDACDDIDNAARRASISPTKTTYDLKIIRSRRETLSKGQIFGATVELLSALVGVASA